MIGWRRAWSRSDRLFNISSPVAGEGTYPELTWVAVTVGWFLGVIIAVSISYAALILGFSIEGSELAAILGFGILRLTI